MTAASVVRITTVAVFFIGWIGIVSNPVVALLVAQWTPRQRRPHHFYCHDETVVDVRLAPSIAAVGSVHPTTATADGSRRAKQQSYYHEVVVWDAPEHIWDRDTRSQLDAWIVQRANARWEGDYARADALRDQIQTTIQNRDGNHAEEDAGEWRIVLHDIPRTEGGGSTWSLVYRWPVAVEMPVESLSSSSVARTNLSILHLAHRALGLAVAHAERGLAVPQDPLEILVQQAVELLRHWNQMDQELRRSDPTQPNSMGWLCMSYDQLQAVRHAANSSSTSNHLSDRNHERLLSWSAVEHNLSGRKAADAAFWFAMAGAQDPNLFALLTNVCVKELQRFGERPSCRLLDVYQMVERLAAAGIQQQDDRLEAVVQQCLAAKGMKESELSTKPLLDLHSDHSALLLWKFSARLRKQKAFLQTAANSYEVSLPGAIKSNEAPVLDNEPWNWEKMFDDPTRPLVCDLGCGMGVSLLGLASLKHKNTTRDGNDHNYGNDFDWSECNFLGVDLSHLTINYAKSIARRWNIHGKVAFMVATAGSSLERVESYPGSVKRILVQFPTPYRLPDSIGNSNSTCEGNAHMRAKGGNSQLPRTVEDGFMVNPTLLQHCADVLHPTSGTLLLQSNCEDVAVWMRSTACETAGFVDQDPLSSMEEIVSSPTQRTLNWVALGGDRATGSGWSRVPILPRTGRTETEIACILNDRPVHRCILKPR